MSQTVYQYVTRGNKRLISSFLFTPLLFLAIYAFFLLLLNVEPAKATTFFSDGFECPPNTTPQTFAAWSYIAYNSGNPVKCYIVSDWASTGTYSMMANGSHDYVGQQYFGGQTTFNVQFDIYQPTLHATGHRTEFLSIRGDSVISTLSIFNNKWMFYYRIGDRFQSFDYYMQLEPKPYTVEVGVVISDTDGEYHVYIDDTEIITITGVDNDNVGGIDYFLVGNSYVRGEVVPTYYDRVVAANGYIGVEDTPLPVTYTLTISSTSGGTTNPASGTYSYDGGSDVSVTAMLNSGYAFYHWSLDGSPSGIANPYSVTMDSNHSLQATFMDITNPTQPSELDDFLEWLKAQQNSTAWADYLDQMKQEWLAQIKN